MTRFATPPPLTDELLPDVETSLDAMAQRFDAQQRLDKGGGVGGALAAAFSPFSQLDPNVRETLDKLESRPITNWWDYQATSKTEFPKQDDPLEFALGAPGKRPGDPDVRALRRRITENSLWMMAAQDPEFISGRPEDRHAALQELYDEAGLSAQGIDAPAPEKLPGERGVVEVLTNKTAKLEVFPFLRDAMAFGSMFDMLEANSRILAGEENGADLSVIVAMQDEMIADIRGRTWPGAIADLTSELPAYAIEIGASMGLYQAGKQALLKGGKVAAKKAFAKAIAKRQGELTAKMLLGQVSKNTAKTMARKRARSVGAKVATWLADSIGVGVVGSSSVWIPNITAGAVQDSLPTVHGRFDKESGAFQLVSTRSGVGFDEAFRNHYVGQVLEIFSENTGRPLAFMLRGLSKPAIGWLAKKVPALGKAGARTGAVARGVEEATKKQLRTRMSFADFSRNMILFNGPVPEIAEEFIAPALKQMAMWMSDDRLELYPHYPTFKEALQMGVSFALFQGVPLGMAYAVNQKDATALLQAKEGGAGSLADVALGGNSPMRAALTSSPIVMHAMKGRMVEAMEFMRNPSRRNLYRFVPESHTAAHQSGKAGDNDPITPMDRQRMANIVEQHVGILKNQRGPALNKADKLGYSGYNPKSNAQRTLLEDTLAGLEEIESNPSLSATNRVRALEESLREVFGPAVYTSGARMFDNDPRKQYIKDLRRLLSLSKIEAERAPAPSAGLNRSQQALNTSRPRVIAKGLQGVDQNDEKFAAAFWFDSDGQHMDYPNLSLASAVAHYETGNPNFTEDGNKRFRHAVNGYIATGLNERAQEAFEIWAQYDPEAAQTYAAQVKLGKHIPETVRREQEAERKDREQGVESLQEGVRVHVRPDPAKSRTVKGTIVAVEEDGFQVQIGGPKSRQQIKVSREQVRPDRRTREGPKRGAAELRNALVAMIQDRSASGELRSMVDTFDDGTIEALEDLTPIAHNEFLPPYTLEGNGEVESLRENLPKNLRNQVRWVGDLSAENRGRINILADELQPYLDVILPGVGLNEFIVNTLEFQAVREVADKGSKAGAAQINRALAQLRRDYDDNQSNPYSTYTPKDAASLLSWQVLNSGAHEQITGGKLKVGDSIEFNGIEYIVTAADDRIELVDGEGEPELVVGPDFVISYDAGSFVQSAKTDREVSGIVDLGIARKIAEFNREQASRHKFGPQNEALVFTSDSEGQRFDVFQTQEGYEAYLSDANGENVRGPFPFRHLDEVVDSVSGLPTESQEAPLGNRGYRVDAGASQNPGLSEAAEVPFTPAPRFTKQQQAQMVEAFQRALVVNKANESSAAITAAAKSLGTIVDEGAMIARVKQGRPEDAQNVRNALEAIKSEVPESVTEEMTKGLPPAEADLLGQREEGESKAGTAGRQLKLGEENLKFGEDVEASKAGARQRKIDQESGQLGLFDAPLKGYGDDPASQSPPTTGSINQSLLPPYSGASGSTINPIGGPDPSPVPENHKKLRTTSVTDIFHALEDVLLAFRSSSMQQVSRIKKGVFSRQVLGYFISPYEVTRVRNSDDFATAAHEVAHALEALVWGNSFVDKSNRRFFRSVKDANAKSELVALGKALYGEKVPTGGYQREGFAEFVRLWVENRDEAKLLAPNFYDYFDTTVLGQHPKGRKALERATKLVERWQAMTASQQIERSRVDPSSLAEKAKKAARDLKYKALPWMKRTWFESLVPLQQFMDTAYVRAGGVDKRLRGTDLFDIASTFRGSSQGIVEAWAKKGMTDLVGQRTGIEALETINTIIKGQDMLSDWVSFLHGQRARALSRPTPRHPGGRDAGVTMPQVDGLMQELQNKYRDPELRDFKRAASIFYRWNEGVLDYLAQASPSMAHMVQRIREADPGHYMPLARELDTITSAYHRTQGSIDGADIIKSLRGSSRRIVAPLETTVNNAVKMVQSAQQALIVEHLISMANTIPGLGAFVERIPRHQAVAFRTDLDNLLQRVKSELGRTASKSPDAEQLEEAITAVQEGGDQALLEEMVAFFSPALQPRTDPDGRPRVAVYRNNEIQFYEFDPALYDAIRGVSPENLLGTGKFMRWAGKPAKWARLGNTAYRASFGLVTNTFRDVQTLLINSQAHGNAFQLFTGWMAGMQDGFLGALPLKTKTAPVRELYESLGARITMQRLGQELSDTRRLTRQIAGFSTRDLWSLQHGPRTAKNAAGKVLSTYVDLIQFPETAARVAEMTQVAKDVGWQPGTPISFDQMVKIVLAGKRATVDFTAAGDLSRSINQIVPFFNATLQGARLFARSLFTGTRKQRLRAYMRGISAFTIPTMALWWANRDKEWYKQLTDDERSLYWHVEIPFTKEILRIPRAFEFGQLFASIPERFANLAYRQDPETMERWFGETLGFMTPVNFTSQALLGESPNGAMMSALQQVLPTVALVPMEWGMNKNFFSDRPIVSDALARKPTEEQYSEYTTRFSVNLGALTGLSPKKLDNAIKGTFGGVSRDLLELLGLGSEEILLEPQWSNTAVIGRIVHRRPGPSPRIVDRMYDKLGELQEIAASDRVDETELQREQRLMLEGSARLWSIALDMMLFTPKTATREQIQDEALSDVVDAMDHFDRGETRKKRNLRSGTISKEGALLQKWKQKGVTGKKALLDKHRQDWRDSGRRIYQKSNPLRMTTSFIRSRNTFYQAMEHFGDELTLED